MQKEDTEADEIIFGEIEGIEPIINTMSWDSKALTANLQKNFFFYIFLKLKMS